MACAYIGRRSHLMSDGRLGRPEASAS